MTSHFRKKERDFWQSQSYHHSCTDIQQIYKPKIGKRKIPSNRSKSEQPNDFNQMVLDMLKLFFHDPPKCAINRNTDSEIGRT
ncbi:hypothetical protein Gasu2_12590 [Galdieria sulphuraria]|nr:hypothetical protein Gasu2_12590 [Galdieria sulphuraria]